MPRRYWPHPPNYMVHGFMADLAHEVKKAVNIPVIAVGRMDDPDVAMAVIEQGKADMVAVGRELDYQIQLATMPKKFMIVGGGPAGMEAARVASLRGHRVALYERTDRLGGHLKAGSVPEFKKDIRKLIAWYEHQLEKLSVSIHTNHSVTIDTIESQTPDEIIFATGSRPIIPPINGIDHPKVAHCIDVLNGHAPLGKKVVVIGGGLVGFEIALWAVEKGYNLTLIERLPGLMATGPSVPKENKQMTIDLLCVKGVKIILNTTVNRVQEDELVLVDHEFKQSTIAYDTLVIAAGMQREDSLFCDAQKMFKHVRRIGDCLDVRNIQGAIWDAYEVVRRL